MHKFHHHQPQSTLMTVETENLQQKPAPSKPLDPFDRKILSALIEDASLSYADISKRVGLSAPAIHERVKRLRASGVIAATSALVNGSAVGKHLLAYIHVDTVGWGKTPELMKIAEHPEIEEIHSVAGDTCMLLKARTAGTQELEALLGILYDTQGVKGTRSYIVLSTHLDRPIQAEVTEEWDHPFA